MNLGVVLALVAALTYGAADFLGGLASRQSAVTGVLIVSQFAGLVALGALLPFAGSRFHPGDVPLGLLAGVAAAAGIGLLYAALAVGRMGVVSPITAVVSAIVPVVFALASGERIALVAAAGCALALVAIVLISAGGELAAGATATAGGRRFALAREPGVALALGSGCAIGVLYVALSHGHADGRLAIVGEMRLVSIPVLAAFALVTRRPLTVSRQALGLVLLAGVVDMLANVGFVLAARVAPLAIAAVLTSLYPASTVLLAYVVLRERLTRVQLAGAAVAISGVAAIAAG